MLGLFEYFWDWGVTATSSGVIVSSSGAVSTGPFNLIARETFINVLGGNYRVWMNVTNSAGDTVSQVLSSKFHVQNVRTTHYTATTPVISVSITASTPPLLTISESIGNVLSGSYKAWIKIASSSGTIVSQVISSMFTVSQTATTNYATTPPIISISITT